MKLLVFAHRGEAQEFIKRLNLKPTEHNGLYLNEKTLLLITGEGIYEVFAKLGLILSKYPIEQVYNFGIAGSLSSKLELGEVCEVKTVYCYTGKPQFQSFTLENSKGGIDLITSDERVLDDDYALTLSSFAPLVDRELWAIAKTCESASIKLRSYKLISDMAGAKTDCFDLKQKALDFSSKMLEFYLNLNEECKPKTSKMEPPLQMSFTQKAKFKTLLEALALTESFDLESFLANALAKLPSNTTEKQKANLLLEHMELGLNPVKLATKEKFEQLASPAREIGAKLLFDQNFEKKKFTIQMEVNNQKNIENLEKLSKALNFSDFEKVWNGEVDV